jgi:hypothetical protein
MSTITKPPVGLLASAMALKLMALLLALPNGLDDLIVGADGADPSSKSSAGKSYVVFGTQHKIYLHLICHSGRQPDTNGNESESVTTSLSDVLYRGFVINGEVAGDQSKST